MSQHERGGLERLRELLLPGLLGNWRKNFPYVDWLDIDLVIQGDTLSLKAIGREPVVLFTIGDKDTKAAGRKMVAAINALRDSGWTSTPMRKSAETIVWRAGD